MLYNTILQMDCLDFLGLFKPQEIDLIVTSPPYNIGTGFGTTWSNKTNVDWYDDKLPEDKYQAQQKLLISKMLEVSKVVCYNHKIRQRNNHAIHPMTWIPSEYLHQEIIWNRGNTPQISKHYFYQTDERIYVLALNTKGIMLNNQKLTTVWRINCQQRTGFPNTFPPQLVQNCIEAYTKQGDLVCDPLMGSGTTIYTAKLLKREYVGCDIQQACVDFVKGIIGS